MQVDNPVFLEWAKDEILLSIPEIVEKFGQKLSRYYAVYRGVVGDVSESELLVLPRKGSGPHPLEIRVQAIRGGRKMITFLN